MVGWFILGIGGLVAFLIQHRNAVPVKITRTNWNSIYKRHAALNALPASLIKAIAFVESSENPTALNKADPSYGLMQILCTGNGPVCSNRFNITGWPVTRELLYDPEVNVSLGAQILSWNVSQYGLKKGIAVYNSWSSRTEPPDGPFPNQDYVDRVLAAKEKIENEKLI